MQQQGRQLDAGLPTARHGGNGAVQIRALQFETPRHLAAFPVRFAAVPHQEVERGFARLKGIVLAQIAQAQARVQDDLAAVELLLTQDGAEQGAFAGSISPHEPDFHRIRNGHIGIIEKDLVPVAFAGFADGDQRRHDGTVQILGGKKGIMAKKCFQGREPFPLRNSEELASKEAGPGIRGFRGRQKVGAGSLLLEGQPRVIRRAADHLEEE